VLGGCQQWTVEGVIIDHLRGFQWHTVKRNFQPKLMHKNWRYPLKSMFTAVRGLTGVPVVVLGHSVGVVGQ
jgi:hypothetical protein